MTGNEPAMPCECGQIVNGEYRGLQTGNYSGIEIGVTKREYFSALAMQGILANPHFGQACDSDLVACMLGTRLAVQFADALIEKLNEKETK